MTPNLPTLPAGWEWKKVADIAFIKGGKRIPKGKKLLNIKTEYPYIRVTDFTDDGTIDIHNIQYIDKDIYDEIKNYTISSNDLYISIAGTIGKTGIIPEILNGVNLTENAVKLVYKTDQIDNKFVYLFTQSNLFLEQAGLATKTVAMPKLSISRLSEIQIPLPPLDEQKRIVSLLDTLFAKIDRSIELLDENITAADALLPSALNTVFGELEEKWEIVPVAQVTNCIVPQRNKPKEFIGDIPWITTDDLVLFEHISESTKGLGLTRDSIKEVQSKTIPAESVLMSCVGDLGIVAISDKEIVVNQQLHTFQCHESLLNTYLQYALYVKKDFMYQIANITTVAYMNKAKCNSIPIPLPPLDIQTQSVEYLDSVRDRVEALKAVQNTKKSRLIALKASILDRAFKGEL